MTACKIDYFRRVALTADAHNKDRWRHDRVGMLRVDCEGEAGAPVGSRVNVWSLGQLDMVDGCLAQMSLAPLAERGDTWLDLKLIRTGAMYIEQGGRTQRIGPGEIVLIASSHAYRQSFDEQTEITALRFPSHALKERGLWHDLRGPIAPDMSAADTRAIGELVMSIAAQRGKTSEGLRRRQGDQLLELIDLLIDDPAVMMRTRRSDATLFRARRFIAQNLRNGELTVSRIAAAACVSDAHLSRLFSGAGQSVMRFVWESRLELAAEMLRHSQGHAQISDIAYRCGFSTPTHFSRVFRARYGISPRDVCTAKDCELSKLQKR